MRRFAANHSYSRGELYTPHASSRTVALTLKEAPQMRLTGARIRITKETRT